MPSPIRILIADAHPLIRSGLRALLESGKGFEIAGEAADGFTAVQMAAALTPDVIVMDISMPRLNGVKAARIIRERNPHARIILTGVDPDEEYVLSAVKAGACGYLPKTWADTDIQAAVKIVAAGGTCMGSPSKPNQR